MSSFFQGQAIEKVTSFYTFCQRKEKQEYTAFWRERTPARRLSCVTCQKEVLNLHSKNPCEVVENEQIGAGLTAFPFGNGLNRDATVLGDMLLRQILLMAQKGKSATEIFHV